MRSHVAIVEARPETILDDYRRVMDLARLDRALGDAPVSLVPGVRGPDWIKGSGSTPWQLEGVLQWLATARDGAAPVTVFPAGKKADLARLKGRNWAWDPVLEQQDLVLAPAESRVPVPIHSSLPLPALGAAWRQGFGMPAGLQGRQTILLPVPRRTAIWPVAGAVSLLQDVLVGPFAKTGRIPHCEIVAELVAFARDVLGPMPVVMDAVLWQVGTVGTRPQAVARNILLAGTDPVAIDTVATRLAGLRPMSQPWLRMCHERGVGAVADEDIRLAGHTELLDLDFGLKIGTLPSGKGRWGLDRVSAAVWQATRGRAFAKQRLDSPWGRLFSDYRTGQTSRS